MYDVAFPREPQSDPAAPRGCILVPRSVFDDAAARLKRWCLSSFFCFFFFSFFSSFILPVIVIFALPTRVLFPQIVSG